MYDSLTLSGVQVIDASPNDELEKNSKTPRQAVGAADIKETKIVSDAKTERTKSTCPLKKM